MSKDLSQKRFVIKGYFLLQGVSSARASSLFSWRKNDTRSVTEQCQRASSVVIKNAIKEIQKGKYTYVVIVDVDNVEPMNAKAGEIERLEEALRTGDIPEEISWLLSLLATVLQPIDRDQVRSPRDIASYLQLRMGHECQEQFCVVCLNNKNRVQKIHTVYKGNVNTAMIRAGEVYREPVKLNSVAIIVAHQHPSSDLTPSPEDVLVTRELRQAGEIFDIELLDSMIVSPSNYVSLRERSLGFDKP